MSRKRLFGGQHKTMAPSALLLILIAAAGCGKSGDAPAPVSVEAAPATIRQAFDKAGADAQKAAAEVGQAVSGGSYDDALGRIAELSVRPGLSAEQRTALAQSRVAVMLKLQADAAAGDARAKEIIELQRASK